MRVAWNAAMSSSMNRKWLMGRVRGARVLASTTGRISSSSDQASSQRPIRARRSRSGLDDFAGSSIPGPQALRMRSIALTRGSAEEDAVLETVLENGVPIGFAVGASVTCWVGKSDLLGGQV